MAARGKRWGDRGQKEEPVKGPKEGRNMTLRKWKARRAGTQNVHFFFQIAVVKGKELGTNKG